MFGVDIATRRDHLEPAQVADGIAGAIKRSLVESDGLTEAEALEQEEKLGAPVFRSADAKEGPTAFFEKRKPVFTGK